MKIGLLYKNYEDCIALLYTFSDDKFNLEKDSDTFSFFHKIIHYKYITVSVAINGYVTIIPEP